MKDKSNQKQYSNVEAVDILHMVANLYIATKSPRDYGTGENYTSVEVHTIKHIADNPGITVTEMARDYGKTKGAVSQILKKIEGKGLVYRKTDVENENKTHLYLTEKGEQLDAAHREFDQINSGESLNLVREQFSDEDINIAFHVLETWLDVRRDVHQKRMSKKKNKTKNK